jgi:hypothetical protein
MCCIQAFSLGIYKEETLWKILAYIWENNIKKGFISYLQQSLMTMQYTFSKGPRMEERNLDLSLKSPHVFVSFSYSTHVKNAEFYNYFRSYFYIHKVLLFSCPNTTANILVQY